METKIVAFITQHALASGAIYRRSAEWDGDTGISWTYNGGPSYGASAYGRAWHRDEAAALTDAERRRSAKIKSLEKQIEKLRGLTFHIVDVADGDGAP